MSLSKRKRSAQDDDSVFGADAGPENREARGAKFLDRKGELQPTHPWPSSDYTVALKTKESAENDRAALFFACRSILARDSSTFGQMIASRRQKQGPKKSKHDEDECRHGTYAGHPLFVLNDDPKELQDFLEALHDFRYGSSVVSLA